MPVLEARPGTSITTSGSSHSADVIQTMLVANRNHRLETTSLGVGRMEGIEDLLDTFSEHRQVTLDGDRSAPIEEATLQNALEFMKALPLDVATPSVGAEADGHITLE